MYTLPTVINMMWKIKVVDSVLKCLEKLKMFFFKFRMNLKKILLSLATLCACCYGNNILSGDVTVGGLFKIQNEVDGECDGIAPLSVKGLEAVKWIFRKLNEANYIPGVTIGRFSLLRAFT